MKVGDVIYCIESDELMVITSKILKGFYSADYGDPRAKRCVLVPGAWTYIKIGRL